MQKPHLKKKGKGWFCFGTGRCSWGKTLKDAYTNWWKGNSWAIKP